MAAPKATVKSGASASPKCQGPDVLRKDATTSPLDQLVRERLETYLARFEDEHGGRRLPRYVEKEPRGFLACGDPAHGFCRIHCTGCASDLLVPFSCKGRAFCPSCGGRRMAEKVREPEEVGVRHRPGDAASSVRQLATVG